MYRESRKIRLEPTFSLKPIKSAMEAAAYVQPRRLMIIRHLRNLPQGMEILAQGQYPISVFSMWRGDAQNNLLSHIERYGGNALLFPQFEGSSRRGWVCTGIPGVVGFQSSKGTDKSVISAGFQPFRKDYGCRLTVSQAVYLAVWRHRDALAMGYFAFVVLVFCFPSIWRALTGTISKILSFFF